MSVDSKKFPNLHRQVLLLPPSPASPPHISYHSCGKKEIWVSVPTVSLLKRRRRPKCHTAQTPAPLEAAITQFTDTVGHRDLLNSSILKTRNTDPLKRRGRTKCHTAQTLAPLEAAITQLTDTLSGTETSSTGVHRASQNRFARGMRKKKMSHGEEIEHPINNARRKETMLDGSGTWAGRRHGGTMGFAFKIECRQEKLNVNRNN